jgi:hypothetical protein
MSDRKKHKGARKRRLEDLLSELPPPTWDEMQARRASSGGGSKCRGRGQTGWLCKLDGASLVGCAPGRRRPKPTPARFRSRPASKVTLGVGASGFVSCKPKDRLQFRARRGFSRRCHDIEPAGAGVIGRMAGLVLISTVSSHRSTHCFASSSTRMRSSTLNADSPP